MNCSTDQSCKSIYMNTVEISQLCGVVIGNAANHLFDMRYVSLAVHVLYGQKNLDEYTDSL